MRSSATTVTLALCVLMLTCGAAALGQDAPDEPLPQGADAPDFEVNTLEGATVRLSDWRGQVVVLNFFISWYRDAGAQLQVMEHLATKYADRGLKLLSVSLDERESGPAVTENFISDQEIAHAVAADPEQEVASSYGVRALPAIFVIGPDGKIAHYHEGYDEGDEANLERMILDALQARVEQTAEAAQEPTQEAAQATEEEQPVCKCFKQKD